MEQLVEFPLGDGSILVEARTEPEVGGVPTRGLDKGQTVIERANRSFEDTIQSIEPAAQAIVHRLRQMAESPDEVHVEFGLDLHAEAGAFIAAVSTTANFKIGLTWRQSGHDGSPHAAGSEGRGT